MYKHLYMNELMYMFMGLFFFFMIEADDKKQGLLVLSLQFFSDFQLVLVSLEHSSCLVVTVHTVQR